MEHNAILDRDGARLASNLGYTVAGSLCFELHCIPTEDAQAFNALCEEASICLPVWCPSLPTQRVKLRETLSG